MDTLVIYAHPKTGGYCDAIRKEVIRELIAKKVKHELIDLYKIKYDPVLKPEEHYTNGGYKISDQNKKFQKKIDKAKNLIFIYPTWWGTCPAILKGWIDRVFTARWAFKYVNGLPIGLLRGRRAILFLTSGASNILSRVFQGGRPFKNMGRDVLMFCGIRTRHYQLGNCKKFDEKRIPEIERMVKKGLRHLRH